MNIALVVPGGVDRSGRERVIPAILWLIERLARHHTVHVFALFQYPEPCSYPLLGATVHNLGRVPRLPIAHLGLTLYRLMTAMRAAGRFDVVHAFWGVPPGLLASFAAWISRTPSVVSLCGGELVALPNIGYGSQLTRRGRILVRAALRAGARITVSTDYMHDLAEGLGYGCDVIPLGVDARLFTPQGISKAPNSNRTQIRTQKRLLHVASLNKVKDQATLLRAMQHVVKHEPDVHLDIIGEDTLNGAVQAHCAELGLNHCVTFHGFLPTDEIVPFYRRADLFVLPSRHDAAPVVVLEAAMCGIPTIGTAVGYVKDWAPERAYAVPISDSDALADGILTLLHDDERRRRMGQAAQAWALAHDADWTAQRFEDLYTQLITARTHRS